MPDTLLYYLHNLVEIELGIVLTIIIAAKLQTGLAIFLRKWILATKVLSFKVKRLLNKVIEFIRKDRN